MAKPIEPTPVLGGKSAESFIRDLNSVAYSEKKQFFLDECGEIFNKTSKK
ncbi:hypothetical protein J4212_06155 [Candidatus Woesearchaeota archaeon]|nr:hypothetical protein [Candidatus Woesearchaeota archaeon]